MKSMPSSNALRIAVIGGGPAGLLAAGTAQKLGADVTVLEHNAKMGRKLLITGKGRCNVTNDCDVTECIANTLSNPRFLYAAFSAFGPKDTIRLMEDHGTPLKTERGRRVFPVSDKSGDVLSALLRYCSGVHFRKAHVSALLVEDGACKGVVTDQGTDRYDAVILATGGLSYPLTGCDGSGYEIARGIGHTVIPPSASLVPLESTDRGCAQMQGLSLKNVAIRILSPTGKCIFEDFGEMLFTHFGVSGPTVLSASAKIPTEDISDHVLSIDMKPALSSEELDRRLLSDFSKYNNRNFENALEDLLPQKMIPVFVQKTGISPATKVHDITKAQRAQILGTMKDLRFPLSSRRPISEAIITKGGIAVKEVNPKTMESKLCQGLFFAGEVLDVDAYTGGYNLQIAFSTGYLAGQSAACPQF